MPRDLALLSTLTGSNYSSLELIFVVTKVFEPLKFDCIYMLLTVQLFSNKDTYVINSICIYI